MEQPSSNPTFCTNNCGFYGSSQFEGMCSKCYREHVSRSLTTGRTNSCNSFYTSNNSMNVSHQNTSKNDDDEVLGRMDEDNDLSTNVVNSTVNKIDEDNSEEQLTTEKNDNQQINVESSVNLLTRVVSTPSMPINISRNIDIPKNDSNISLSVMEASSLGDSMSPLTASSVDKKKRNRCTWPSCNKKLGLTGFDCRCGGQFCPIHRYANEHNCTFDYKEHGQNEIRKNMPVVQAERVRRI